MSQPLLCRGFCHAMSLLQQQIGEAGDVLNSHNAIPVHVSRAEDEFLVHQHVDERGQVIDIYNTVVVHVTFPGKINVWDLDINAQQVTLAMGAFS